MPHNRHYIVAETLMAAILARPLISRLMTFRNTVPTGRAPDLLGVPLTPGALRWPALGQTDPETVKGTLLL